MIDLNELKKKAYECSKKRAENGGTKPFSTRNLLKHCATEVVEAMEAYTEYVNDCGVQADKSYFISELSEGFTRRY